jgi:hypothetical protein
MVLILLVYESAQASAATSPGSMSMASDNGWANQEEDDGGVDQGEAARLELVAFQLLDQISTPGLPPSAGLLRTESLLLLRRANDEENGGPNDQDKKEDEKAAENVEKEEEHSRRGPKKEF